MRTPGALAVCALVVMTAGPVRAQITFTNATGSAEIGFNYALNPFPVYEEHIGGGGAAEDFNGDGLIDIFLGQSGGYPCHLYINDGDGTFSQRALVSGAALSGIGTVVGAGAADFDADGDIDLCVSFTAAPHALLINDGTGHFTVDLLQLTLPADLSATSPSWGDADNDGLLELALGEWDRTEIFHEMTVYRNLGGGSLAPYEFRLAPANDRYVFSPRFADLDGDRLQDLPLTADFSSSQLYMNRGGGMFENTTAVANVGVDRAGMGAAIGDYDNDGDLDWFVSSISTNPDNVGNRLYRNRGDGIFDDVTDASGVNDGIWGWGSAFADFDLDGDLDIYHTTGWTVFYGANHLNALLFENQGDGTFVDAALQAGAVNDGEGRGLMVMDYDNDGDMDMMTLVSGQVIQPGNPRLFRNDTPRGGRHWLKVTLAGAPPLHPHGIGSRVYVHTGGATPGVQMRELNASTHYLATSPGRIAHFGLGTEATAEEVRAEWIDNTATIIPDVAADQAIGISSPVASVAPRQVATGETVTADGSAASAFGPAREWIIDGATHPDPAEVTFASAGEKEFRLVIYDAPGGNPVRAEVFRVTVVSSGTPAPSPTPTAAPAGTPTATPGTDCCSGDADNSGSFVDANDFIAVQASFGSENEVGGAGDADCSGGFVDANDFIAVQANFGADCG